MAKKKVKATKLTVGLPFNLGSLEFENDEAQQRAAWSLYVELSTRIAVQPLEEGEGILREALTSLYNVFGITRQILREAGPEIAKGPQSFGATLCVYNHETIAPNNLVSRAQEKRDDRGTKQQVRNRGGRQTQASPTYSGI